MAGMGTALDRQPLSRDAIVTAAIEVADTGGVSALSMRKLAARLGYEVMSLYNHVANKDALLAEMVDAVASKIEVPADDVAPLDALRKISISFHSVLVRHPWAPPLWHRYLPGGARTRLMETQLRTFDASGLSPELAHHGFHALNNHVLGFTLQELDLDAAFDSSPAAMAATGAAYIESIGADEHPHTAAHVQAHIDGDVTSSFELVLDLILDGLVRLDRDR